MALSTDKIKLPTEVTMSVIKGASSQSTIASLSPSTPQLFQNTENLLFRAQAEAEVVGELGEKGGMEYSIPAVPGKIVKVQTTTRVSNELEWADEDARLQIMTNIQEDQGKAIARSLDYVVYHGVNPRTGAVMPGYTALSTSAQQVTQITPITALSPSDDLDALVSKLFDDWTINGLALSPKFTDELRKIRIESGARMYDIPMNGQPGSIEGIPAQMSNTVNGKVLAVPTNVLAFMGDFSMIKWGMVRDMYADMITMGDPDGAGDLKRTNEIAYRTEAVFSYAVLDPNAFAVLKAAVA